MFSGQHLRGVENNMINKYNILCYVVINVVGSNIAKKGNRENVCFCILNRMVRCGNIALEIMMLVLVKSCRYLGRSIKNRANSKCKGPEAGVYVYPGMLESSTEQQ